MILVLGILGAWTVISFICALLFMSRNRIERREKRKWEALHPHMNYWEHLQ
jgi:hypothetical protein